MLWNKTMFRVTEIPTILNVSDTAKWLGQALGIDPSSVKIHSLAADINGRRKFNTATVSFRTRPDLLPPTASEWDFESPVYPGTEDEKHFRIDINFNSLTPLSPVDTISDESRSIDCIVIHGWGGHALGSFKAQGNSLYSWIRDDLPQSIPELRVWTYGYDAKLTSADSTADVDSYADELRWALRGLRRDTHANETRRPMIFIAHSLGGWLFKKAMVLMNQSSDIDDQQNRLYTYGALFFGVPNHGMKTTAMATMIEDLPTQFTLYFLDQSRGERYRQQQHEEFCQAFNFSDSRVVQFHELRFSHTVQKDEATGKWQRTGPQEMLVSRLSATSHWTFGKDLIVEINADHSNIVKFSEGDRIGYPKVIYTLEQFVKAAHGVVRDRGGKSYGSMSIESLRGPLDIVSQELDIDKTYAQVKQLVEDNKESTSQRSQSMFETATESSKHWEDTRERPLQRSQTGPNTLIRVRPKGMERAARTSSPVKEDSEEEEHYERKHYVKEYHTQKHDEELEGHSGEESYDEALEACSDEEMQKPPMQRFQAALKSVAKALPKKSKRTAKTRVPAEENLRRIQAYLDDIPESPMLQFQAAPKSMAKVLPKESKRTAKTRVPAEENFGRIQAYLDETPESPMLQFQAAPKSTAKVLPKESKRTAKTRVPAEENFGRIQAYLDETPESSMLQFQTASKSMAKALPKESKGTAKTRVSVEEHFGRLQGMYLDEETPKWSSKSIDTVYEDPYLGFLPKF